MQSSDGTFATFRFPFRIRMIPDVYFRIRIRMILRCLFSYPYDP